VNTGSQSALKTRPPAGSSNIVSNTTGASTNVNVVQNNVNVTYWNKMYLTLPLEF